MAMKNSFLLLIAGNEALPLILNIIGNVVLDNSLILISRTYDLEPTIYN